MEPRIPADNRFNTAISALTYGLHCLVLDPRSNTLHACIMSVHEEFINILHLIISQKASYLLKLHEIYNITDNEFSTETKLKDYHIEHYLILYTQSLDSFTFAFKSEYEKEICKMGVMLFVREAKLYYERLNQFDPFKAEAMMTYLYADKDGGNLLDIAEIQNILSEMKIYKTTEQILKDISQINKILFNHQKLKKPKDMKDQELNQLGFQYLLRFYSIKEDLARIFRDFCSQYKVQSRGTKVSLVSVVRYNENPIMSASQLRQFYQKMLFLEVTEEYCLGLIQSFPVYDTEGKEKTEKQELISFNNFCSLLSSNQNSAFVEEKKELHQSLDHTLTDYFIYADFTDYSLKGDKEGTKINHFQLSLKRGIRCLHFHLRETKQHQPVIAAGEQGESLEELLKIIAAKAFQFNNFPIILKFEHEGMSKISLDKTGAIISQLFDDMLFTPPSNFQQHDSLPSLSALMKKVLIMANVSSKFFKTRDLPDEPVDFYRLVSLFGAKVDFQRKGLFAWNYCQLQDSKIHKFEIVQDQNLSNFTKKIMCKAGPTQQKGTQTNKSSSIYLRLGIQIVGLSFKNINQENYYIQSLFLSNGGAKCGYLMKPSWMCHKDPKNLYPKNFDTPIFVLSVKVLSGQNCIMNQLKNQRVYVEASIRGNKIEEEKNLTAVSGPAQPGYYVQFGLQCQFTVYCEDLAVLLILVRGETSKNIVSGRAIPIKYLRQGLHPAYLLGNNFKQSLSSYLFIHAERKSIPKKHIQPFDYKL